MATVSSKGGVKGVAPGEAVITATAKDGSLVTGTKTSPCCPRRQGIQLTADGEQASSGVIDIASEKKTILLQAQISPAGATQAVTWTTSSAKIAKVSADGLSCTVTGVKEGSATITAKAKDGTGKKATFSVSVKQLVKTVEITGASALIGGKSATLKAAVTPSNATNKSVNWTSSDEGVATVSSKGVVTAAAVTQPETVTITATAKDASGFSGTLVVTVVPRWTPGDPIGRRGTLMRCCST